MYGDSKENELHLRAGFALCPLIGYLLSSAVVGIFVRPLTTPRTELILLRK